jgi:transcription antitermination factor NusG
LLPDVLFQDPNKECKLIEKHINFWFVIYTKPNSEKKVFDRLKNLNLELFLPLLNTVKIWSDRKKVSIPLIPSVVFVRCLITDLYSVKLVDGVIKILMHSGQYAKVRQIEIDSIEILLNDFSQVTNLEKPTFQKGDKVEAISGPFRGLIAQAVDYQGVYRLSVELITLNTFLTVNVPTSSVKLIL